MANLNLRNQPAQFSSLEAANRWANNSAKAKMVILGDNGKFWVASFRDAQTLVKAGFELAN